MSNTENPKIEVRDLRAGEWLWTHKAVLFSPHISASEFKVYCGLAAYAGNSDQQSWPSMITLGTKLNMSKSTVVRSLKILEATGLIRTERREGTSNLYSLLKCEDVQAPAAPKKAQSAHHHAIDTFHKASMHFRGMKPRYAPKDLAALRRVLKEGVLTEDQFDQLIIFYMADPVIKRKFGPSLSTFLSAGIFNGLMNRMLNGETFYKDLDRHAAAFYGSAQTRVTIEMSAMEAMKASLLKSLKVAPYEMAEG